MITTKKGERVTRDVVSRGIYSEMRKNNNPEQEGVFISMAHLGPTNVRKKFKGMVKRCEDSSFHLAAGMVGVVPTAHYFMGGVVVDIDTRTAMEGLYVAYRLVALWHAYTPMARRVSHRP